jgi:CO/xanthine dehydrogenase FAD-binding subunit
VLKQYVLAKSMDDVLKCFEEYPGEARIIAGGTDLVLDMESGKVQCSCLIDITGIDELKKIELADQNVTIGAAVTHSEVNRSELIKATAAVLSQACGTVGSLQIRNIATVVGNVVNGQPAADAAVALIALGAEAEVVCLSGTRTVPLEDLYAGLGKTSIDCAKEIVTSVKFPALKENQGSAFVRFAQREALALPMLNVAVSLSLNEDKTIEWVRIAMAPVGPKPVRARSAEEMLTGSVISGELFEKAAEEALKEACPRDSALRGTSEYRKDVLPVLVRRALEAAVASIKYF